MGQLLAVVPIPEGREARGLAAMLGVAARVGIGREPAERRPLRMRMAHCRPQDGRLTHGT